MTKKSHPPPEIQAHKEALVIFINKDIKERSDQMKPEKGCGVCGKPSDRRKLAMACEGCLDPLCEECASKYNHHCKECVKGLYAFFTYLTHRAKNNTKLERGFLKKGDRLAFESMALEYCRTHSITLDIIRELQENIREAFMTFHLGYEKKHKSCWDN